MFTRIGLHTFTIYNTPARVSTVKLTDTEYETMVMFDDGEEIESVTTHTLAEAKKTHNKLMNKYNDLVYEGSIEKLLGADNYGQFVHTVIAC